MKNFVIYLIIVLLPFSYSISNYTISPTDCLGMVVGLVVWTFAEYGFHRFAFHNKHLSPKTYVLLAYNHAQHHQFPNGEDSLFLPLRLVLPVAMVLFVLTVAVGGLIFASLFLCGIFIGLCFYEFVHYQAHYKFYNVWPLNYLTRRHLQHHYENEAALFGVTSPLMDWVFRTNGQSRSLSVNRKRN